MIDAFSRFDPIEYRSGSSDPAEQRSIQEAVYRGANSYKPDVSLETNSVAIGMNF